MISINQTRTEFEQGSIDKPTFIKTMYEEHHAKLFEYAAYLSKTNVKKIEIEDDRLIFTSRDHGVRIACAPGDYRLAPIETLNFFDYEKDDSDMMENLVADGDYFFDIGANIGWYSINIAVLRRSARVFCFEPIPKTYQNLQINLALNSVPNVTSHDFGLSNQISEFTFYYYPEGSGGASSVNVTGRSDIETVQCKVRTLDDYVAEGNLHVDFIKCDVEGAELLVFQGGATTITRDKPIVFSEILRKWSAKFNYSPNEIFDFFRERGYRAFVAKGRMLMEFGNMDESTVETNFFFLHAEKHRELIHRFSKID